MEFVPAVGPAWGGTAVSTEPGFCAIRAIADANAPASRKRIRILASNLSTTHNASSASAADYRSLLHGDLRAWHDSAGFRKLISAVAGLGWCCPWGVLAFRPTSKSFPSPRARTLVPVNRQMEFFSDQSKVFQQFAFLTLRQERGMKRITS